jgi:hypothetical protein
VTRREAGTAVGQYRGLAILNGYRTEAGLENERWAIDNFLVAGGYLQAAIGSAGLAEACRFKDSDQAIALLGWFMAYQEAPLSENCPNRHS